MPQAPPCEPFFVLAARYLSRLAEFTRGQDGTARDPAPEGDGGADGYFSRMIGFAPEPDGEAGAAREEPGAAAPAPGQPATPPAGRDSGA